MVSWQEFYRTPHLPCSLLLIGSLQDCSMPIATTLGEFFLYIFQFHILRNCTTVNDLTNTWLGTNKVFWIELSVGRLPLGGQLWPAGTSLLDQEPLNKFTHTQTNKRTSSLSFYLHISLQHIGLSVLTDSALLHFQSFFFFSLFVSRTLLFPMRHNVCCITVFNQSPCCFFSAHVKKTYICQR